MKFSFSARFRKTDGFATLMSVFLVGLVGVAIGVNLLFLSTDAIRDAAAFGNSLHAKNFANACAEEALQQIRDATAFAGGGGLSFAEGSCGYVVANLGGQNREIQITGLAGEATRKIFIQLDAINPKINLTSWKEVADFN